MSSILSHEILVGFYLNVIQSVSTLAEHFEALFLRSLHELIGRALDGGVP